MKPDQQSNYWQHEPDAPKGYEEQPPAPTGPIVTLTPDTLDGVVDVTVERDEPPTVDLQQPINWQAQEAIHHERNTGWFVLFGVVAAALLVIAIFLMRSWTFALLIAVMAAAVVVYARRPPRTLGYTLSPKGLYVADRLYEFSAFKSFGVIRDGDEYSIMLIPTKRFMPGVTIYFPHEVGERLVDMLGARLPMEELHLDVIDKVVRKLRL